MANISYGVNFLPKTNNTYTLGNSDYKWSTIYSVNLNITDLDVANSISMDRKSSTTVGENSVALGYNNTASGAGTVAEGYASVASGNCSHTEGGYTTASAQAAHAEGDYTTASGTSSHAEGGSTTASAQGAHAEGYSTTASYAFSHAEGMYTTANSSGAHAEGSTTKSRGTGSHTEGIFTHASGMGSHAEGLGKSTTSNQEVIVDENYGAMGTAAHAEGMETKAYGAYSHAEGIGTITNSTSAHVFGSFNAKDTAPAYDENTTYEANDVVIKDNVFMIYTGSAWGGTKGNYVEIVGNGVADQDNLRSNARVLDWSGNERLNGYLYVGCNADSSGGTRIPHDIQVNGTSIVSNGVANIPYTATGVHGLVRPGDGLYADNGQLLINSATTGIIKAGASNYLPITPKRQHEAVFYGLTKLAGVDMSSSSNAVGTYTDEAKAAIRTLIGAINPVILTYNTSTWNDFITAYTSGATIYCYDEGSTNGQYRIAQLAYVNDKTNPTYAQFQYYRARSNKTTSNLCDELIQYSLDSTQGWDVELKYTGPKTITTTNGISVSFSNNNMTISGIEATTSASGLMSATDKTLLNNATINEGAVADKTNITVTDAANSNIKEISYKIEPITPTTVITYSKNLLNPAARTDEYYISSGGVYTASPGDCYSGPIDVEPGDEIYIYGIAGKSGNRRIHGYTAEDVWSKQVTYFAVTLDNAFDSGKITIPAGVYKLRLSFNQADTDVMIEKGSKTSYEAYYDPITTYTFTALSTSTLYVSGTSASSSNSDIVSHTITFPSNTYAVTVNIINDTSITINKTWDYIASYDDETIGDEWYSSRGDSSTLDAPAAGDAVIYKLSTPTTLTGYTTSTTLPTLYSGTNYIWLSINGTLTNLIDELKYSKQDTLTYELPAASTHLLGGIKPGRGITMDNELANIDIATANKLGLVKIGSNINITADGTISIAEYALKDNPIFTGSLSMGRMANSRVGTNSVALGNDVIASGDQSAAFGTENIISGNYSIAAGESGSISGTDSIGVGHGVQVTNNQSIGVGYQVRARGLRSAAFNHATYAQGGYSFASGNHAYANGNASRAHGVYITANGAFSTVLGKYNIADTATVWNKTTAYSVGNIVSDNNGGLFECIQANTNNGITNTSYWRPYGIYALQVGNGTADNARSNAMALDWNGNQYLNGTLYVGCNADSTGGKKVVAVGDTYTDVEKANIQKAIGVYKAPWEVIRDVTTMTNAEEADIEITVDDDGNSFELTDIIVWMTVPSSNDFASKYGDYGRVRYYYSENNYDDTISGEINVAVGGSSRGFYSYIEQDYPMLKKWATNQTTASNNGTMINYMTNNFSSQIAPALIITYPRYYTKIVFRKITGNIKFKIYGRRKWTT